MKRTWIGIGLLAALLILGLFTARWMERCHSPVAGNLKQAAEAAMAQDWNRAELLADRARGSWERSRKITAVLADHGPMEEIDSLFAELKIFLLAREQVHFASVCGQLSRQVEAIGEAHGLMWWNIL